MEVSVDPRYRRLRIGQRLYDARKQLCQTWGLKGIVFGGRMPGLARRMKSVGSAENYVEAVVEKKIKDAAIGFHLANDFELIGVLPGYDVTDSQSLGYATHMFWRNPLYDEGNDAKRDKHALDKKDSVRVATVQFQMRGIQTKEEFQSTGRIFRRCRLRLPLRLRRVPRAFHAAAAVARGKAAAAGQGHRADLEIYRLVHEDDGAARGQL